jgi:hypothetical protein
MLPIMALMAGSSDGSETKKASPKSQNTLPHSPLISLAMKAMF